MIEVSLENIVERSMKLELELDGNILYVWIGKYIFASKSIRNTRRFNFDNDTIDIDNLTFRKEWFTTEMLDRIIDLIKEKYKDG